MGYGPKYEHAGKELTISNTGVHLDLCTLRNYDITFSFRRATMDNQNSSLHKVTPKNEQTNKHKKQTSKQTNKETNTHTNKNQEVNELIR